MFPEDPKDAEIGDEAENLLTHWPLTDKSPEEWEDLATRIDARIRITQVGSTPDYLLDAPLLEDHDVQRRSQPRMKRPSVGSLTALAKASLAKDDAVTNGSSVTGSSAVSGSSAADAEREALARSLLSLAVKARSEARSHTTGARSLSAEAERSVERVELSELVNAPPMQLLATRQPSAASAYVAAANPEPRAADFERPTDLERPAETQRRERGTMWFGIAFGVLGMAAAVIMYVTSTREPVAKEARPVALAAPVAAPGTVEAPAARAGAQTPGTLRAAGETSEQTDERVALNVEDVPLADAEQLTAAPKDRTGPARPSSHSPAPAAPARAAAGTAPQLPPAAGPSEPGMVMADSRGALPDHPSTGAVQAAVGTVMVTARACVAGQGTPSRATVSFGSDGRVRSVAVAGPAAGTSAEGCLRNALGAARVQPFARPSYSVNLTVRSH